MKKGIYIVYEDIEKNINGVNKKIFGQITAFEENGIQMKQYLILPEYVKGYKILYRLPFTNLAPRWKWNKCLSECDFIYLRRPYFMSGAFIKFLKEIKRHSDVKIVMEIPTYPYDAEITKSKRNYLLYLKEKLARKKIVGLIDRIATLTNDKMIFGVETFNIKNGYDVEKINVRKVKQGDGIIDLCFVALFDFSHGYERLIMGLKDYYDKGGTRTVKFHFAGDGPECNKYKNLVSKFNLQNYVTFYGMQTKEQIEKIYNICDIGVGSLGGYKKNIYYSCDLKSREYLAVGLPIVTGNKTDIMEYEELRPYILEFPNDDSVVEIDKIVQFYDLLYTGDEKENQKMADNIRSIAMDKLNMQVAMKEVIDYVKEERI